MGTLPTGNLSLNHFCIMRLCVTGGPMMGIPVIVVFGDAMRLMAEHGRAR